ncbi:family 43 glycosylhydrolase [Paenibacillus harenae]|uniref:family 43 glycosylhydrolase n=1 Tax=Paenibacillus harenae TaxID=306543 RepID=UPI0027948620|nr:family 43 glycosylhydrolase [Paenibacillus harenae]MDQ0060174.1 hypothetical protein [Paenibacillus harenae]
MRIRTKHFGWRLSIKAAIFTATIILALVACQADEVSKVELLKEDAKVYTNSFKLDGEWEDYGIGDPYILRYNGRFYLYCSTKDWRPGIKAWSSDNLVDWQYEGLVTESEITTGAYAPEVVYWNGNFYLYTSPAGQGHYVLRSDNPTGPFTVETDNLGQTIDGSVFIDDDGKWYFTNAGTQGIVAHEMPDPFTIDIGVTTNAFLGHWTEGSMIWKRNGLYYMTYTGNHVFSNGYRVNYATSKISPFGDYAIPSNNPIIINTEETFKGLGHSATVLGPDMDSYYVTYHNLVGHSAEGPPVRELNIDRLAYNGDKLVVLGATHDHEQPAPAMPALYGWLTDNMPEEQWDSADANTILSKASTAENFIAEYNFRLTPETGLANKNSADAVFAYKDADNYSSVRLLPTNDTLQLLIVEEGAAKVAAEASLPDDFDYSKLHTIRVEQREGRVLVFFDTMKKLEAETSGARSGKIGYMSSEDMKPVYEYTAFSNDSDGSSDFEAYKPLPGAIEAVHYLKGEDRGYHVGNKYAAAEYRKSDGVRIGKTEDGSYSVRLQDSGDWLKYKINTKKDSPYGIAVTVKKPDTDAVLEWSVDGAKAVKTTIDADDAAFGEGAATLRIGTLTIPKGFHELKVKLKAGSIELESFQLFAAKRPVEDEALDGDSAKSLFGMFGSSEGTYTGSGIDDDMLFAGDDDWDNYAFETEILLNDQSDRGGIYVRATNESYHPDQVKDAAMGYYIGISSSIITLNRMNYDSYPLASETVSLEAGRKHAFKVTAEGGRIEVFLDGSSKPLIAHTDPEPFLHGKIGIRSEHSAMSFANMSIHPIKK